MLQPVTCWTYTARRSPGCLAGCLFASPVFCSWCCGHQLGMRRQLRLQSPLPQREGGGGKGEFWVRDLWRSDPGGGRDPRQMELSKKPQRREAVGDQGFEAPALNMSVNATTSQLLTST